MTEINRETIERLHRRVIHKQEVFRQMGDDLFKRRGITNQGRAIHSKEEAYRSFSEDLMMILDGEKVPDPGQPWDSDEMLGYDLQ